VIIVHWKAITASNMDMSSVDGHRHKSAGVAKLHIQFHPCQCELSYYPPALMNDTYTIDHTFPLSMHPSQPGTFAVDSPFAALTVRSSLNDAISSNTFAAPLGSSVPQGVENPLLFAGPVGNSQWDDNCICSP
jgi:hypothetical protein